MADPERRSACKRPTGIVKTIKATVGLPTTAAEYAFAAWSSFFKFAAHE